MLRICFAIDTLDRHYKFLTSPSCAMKQMEIDAYDIKNYDENFIENKLVWYSFYDFDLEDEDLIEFFNKACIKEGLTIIPVAVDAIKPSLMVDVLKKFEQFLAKHTEFEGKIKHYMIIKDGIMKDGKYGLVHNSTDTSGIKYGGITTPPME